MTYPTIAYPGAVTALGILMAGAAAGIGPALPAVASNVQVRVHSGAAQTIQGWGCYALSEPGASLAAQPAAIQAAFFRLGIDFLRVKLKPQVANRAGGIDGGAPEMRALVDTLRLARNHGVSRYVISVWSPPVHMKGPEATENGVAADGEPEYLRPAQAQSYADYLAAAVAYLDRQGVGAPEALSIQNEPNIAPPEWDGCEYTMNATTIATWRRVVKATRAALDAAGYSHVVLFGPEGNSFTSNLTLLGDGFKALTQDPELDHALGAFALHSYNALGWQQLSVAMRAHPRETWMLEWSQPDVTEGAASDLEWTINAVRRMNADLVDLNVSHWCWWYGWRPKKRADGEALFYTIPDDASRRPIFTRLYDCFQRLWTTVRPGWRLKHTTVRDDEPDASRRLTGDGRGQGWDNVDLSAFESPDRSTDVVLLANPTHQDKTITTLSGVSGSRADLYVMDERHTMSRLPSIPIAAGIVKNIHLPSYGVEMIVCRK